MQILQKIGKQPIRLWGLKELGRVALVAVLAVNLLATVAQATTGTATPNAPTSAAPLQITAQATGTRLVWHSQANSATGEVTAANLESVLQTLRQTVPTQRYQGYDLPMQAKRLSAKSPESHRCASRLTMREVERCIAARSSIAQVANSIMSQYRRDAARLPVTRFS